MAVKGWIAVGVCVLASACGGGGAKTSFSTIEQVTDKLAGTPAACAKVEHDENKLGTDSGSCLTSGARISVVVVGTETPTQIVTLAKTTGAAVLVGPGWMLASGDRNLLDAAKKKLGGKYA